MVANIYTLLACVLVQCWGVEQSGNGPFDRWGRKVVKCLVCWFHILVFRFCLINSSGSNFIKETDFKKSLVIQILFV